MALVIVRIKKSVLITSHPDLPYLPPQDPLYLKQGPAFFYPEKGHIDSLLHNNTGRLRSKGWTGIVIRALS